MLGEPPASPRRRSDRQQRRQRSSVDRQGNSSDVGRFVVASGIGQRTRRRFVRNAAQHRCLDYLKKGIIFFRIGDVMPKSRKLFKL